MSLLAFFGSSQPAPPPPWEPPTPMPVTVAGVPTAPPWHMDAPINLTTYVANNDEAVHPSVVDFGGKWNGYRFWMAFTPYPVSDGFVGEPWENPSIAASNDCINWIPVGAQPLYSREDFGVSYLSDTEMVWDEERQRLHLWFRPGGPPEGGNYLYTSSADGVEWAQPTLLTGKFGLSPAVVREASKLWRMWHRITDTATGTHYLALHSATNPAGPWGTPTLCAIPQSAWHGDVIKHDDRYWLISENGAIGITLASSTNGIDWAFNDVGTIPISGPTGTWTQKHAQSRLYRPTITPHENGTHMRVWYSVNASGQGYRMAYTELPLSLWP